MNPASFSRNSWAHYSISSNTGKVKSHGVDVAVDYNKSFSNGFFITGRGTFTYATNEVVVRNEPQYHTII